MAAPSLPSSQEVRDLVWNRKDAALMFLRNLCSERLS